MILVGSPTVRNLVKVELEGIKPKAKADVVDVNNTRLRRKSLAHVWPELVHQLVERVLGFATLSVLAEDRQD